MAGKHTIKITRCLNTDIQTMGLFARYTLIFDDCYHCSWCCRTSDISISVTEYELDMAKRILFEQLCDNIDGLSKDKYESNNTNIFGQRFERVVFNETMSDEELDIIRRESIRKKKIIDIEKRKRQINKMFQG